MSMMPKHSWPPDAAMGQLNEPKKWERVPWYFIWRRLIGQRWRKVHSYHNYRDRGEQPLFLYQTERQRARDALAKTFDIPEGPKDDALLRYGEDRYGRNKPGA